MRKWELIKYSKVLIIKSEMLSNLFNEKYGLKLGEFNNTTGTERVNSHIIDLYSFKLSIIDHIRSPNICSTETTNRACSVYWIIDRVDLVRQEPKCSHGLLVVPARRVTLSSRPSDIFGQYWHIEKVIVFISTYFSFGCTTTSYFNRMRNWTRSRFKIVLKRNKNPY